MDQSEKSKLRHDFINNALRIEVINKIMTEQLEKNEQINNELFSDLEQFLKDHLEYLKKLKN